jgi:hypothetical protein
MPWMKSKKWQTMGQFGIMKGYGHRKFKILFFFFAFGCFIDLQVMYFCVLIFIGATLQI